MMDSSYQVVDSVRMENYLLDSHDFIAMENGHFLIFGLELRTMDLSTLVDTGNVAATVKGCVIQELDAEKNVIFEWNSFDHYEITDTYKDLSSSSVDYVHPNALEIDHDGNKRNPSYSRAAEYEMDEEARTIELVWKYDTNKEVFGKTGGEHTPFAIWNNPPWLWRTNIRSGSKRSAPRRKHCAGAKL